MEDNKIEEIEIEEELSLADDIAKLKAADKEQAPAEDILEKVEEDVKQNEEEEEKEDETLLKAREDYKRRQEERRKQSTQVNYEKQAAATVDDADKQAIEFVKQLQKQQVFERNIKQAEVELTGLEGEFKVAYPDYEDKVSQAIKLTKYRLIEQGMGEAEAEQMLRREKVLLADKAAAAGKDPVEAVYNEAKTILKVFEKFAEDMGYTKGKKKTTLQALREVSKPNAMSGGAGKGATAARRTFDDMEGDEINEISIGQLLKGGL